ncbi:MAG TPA: carbamoyltransferase HypF, partial [Clostridia bacterium]|nr:carbamoyltransferase HypF [Clostridia bacterium]
MIRYRLKISGIVQGVGFRPFLYREAARFCIRGFVRNTSYGVYAEIEGGEAACAAFIEAIRSEPPPLARVVSLEAEPAEPRGDEGFVIVESEPGARSALVSPDIGICDACRGEIFDTEDRRYRYPFTNCTDCGPRFTIIRDIPYDRKSTTMARFIQCPDCQAEYDNPAHRRFHAQPNACPVCGPRLIFLREGREIEGDPFALFDAAIARGETVAVKGLGGFHLACDAKNEAAVARLRRNKARYEKPFAVMMRNAATVRRCCELSQEEEALLTCRRKPIVLLKKKGGALAPSVAPGNARLGVMLPYTPLHCLLMENREALVLTSGNVSDRPMVFRDEDVPAAFAGLADAVLTHERGIARRVDDSVMIVSRGAARFIRRARGYVPEPIPIRGSGRVILAAGAQQKNAFCLVKGGNAFVSGHIGDLDDPETERSYKEEITSFRLMFDAAPEAVACDLHPDYLATRYAKSLGLPLVPVQHHRAHFASVLAEHGIRGNALGFIFDGTGLGDDGLIWGGEAFFGSIAESARAGHLLPFPLLGGDAAAREPWRCALAVAEIALGRKEALALRENRREAEILLRARDAGVNAPLSTSMGRLFDAIASLAGVRQTTSYEGQAAVELEQAADGQAEGSYRFDILDEGGMLVFDWRALVADAARDARKGVGAGTISARF